MRKVLSLGLSAIIATAAVGCYTDPDTNTQIGAAAGGVIGAGLGAVVGAQTGDPGAGVAIGSVAGALAGGAIGNQIDAQEKRYASNEERIQRQEEELGSTRRQIEGLRRTQDDSQGGRRGGAQLSGSSEMRARPGRIIAKEDMSTSTRMRLAQMAADGKAVNPFAGREGLSKVAGVGKGVNQELDRESEEEARAGLKLSKKGQAVSSNKSKSGAINSQSAKLGKKVKGASGRQGEEAEKESRTEVARAGESRDEEMMQEIPEAGRSDTTESESDALAGTTGLSRPSSIFSPLPPSESKTEGQVGQREARLSAAAGKEGSAKDDSRVGSQAASNDTFRWGKDSDRSNGERDDFRVGGDSNNEEAKGRDTDVKPIGARVGKEERAKRGLGKSGVGPSLPEVSEDTLGELLDKDQVEPRSRAASVASDEAAIAENAKKIQSITSKDITDTVLEEVEPVKDSVKNVAGELANAGSAGLGGAITGGRQQEAELKLAKSRADAAKELARYGEESTLGDLSELEGDIDRLAKTGDSTGDGATETSGEVLTNSESGEQMAQKLADSKSPCSQAAADLKEGMSVTGHGDKLFYYRRAIRLCPNDPSYHNALGEFYLSLKRYDDAKHEFKEALAVNPSYHKSQQNLKEVDKLRSGG